MAPRGTGILIGVGFGSQESEPVPREKPFAPPSDVKFFAGEGAEVSDLKRGYKDPGISDDPKYDKVNYKDRWTEPNRNADDDGNDPLIRDLEFRDKDRQTQGLFVRTPFERGR